MAARKDWRGLRWWVVPLSCLLSVSCVMVGPNYKEPKLKVADRWLDSSPVITPRKSKGSSQQATWWRAFHDETLNALINQGINNNLSLQTAGVRVLQSRAQLAQAVGNLYPQEQALVGSYDYQRIGGGMLQDVLPSSFNLATLGFSAGWELDFWGKYRRAIQSNNAAFLASVAAYDHALVTLNADVASTYINIRTHDALIEVTKANIKLQQESLKIATVRFKEGQTSLLDVQQAQTQLSKTQAQLPQLLSKLQHEKGRLGVLLGVVPTAVDPFLVKNRQIPVAPRTIEVDIPKEMLAQRPDIHQARLEAVAQSEAIGMKKAALYPALSLRGAFVFAGTNLFQSSINDMFSWNNLAVIAGPSLSWPVLNYGQITNAIRAQDAVFQQALLKYMNLALQAQQEVQTNMVRYVQAKKSEQALAVANQSAKQALKLALIRYKEGATDYTTVLDAGRQQLQVQTELVNAKGEIVQALVALYRALGGGWQIRQGKDIVPDSIKTDMAARTNWGNLLQPEQHTPPSTRQQAINSSFQPNW